MAMTAMRPRGALRQAAAAPGGLPGVRKGRGARMMQLFGAPLLIALAALDAEHLWLPDWITLPGIGIGVGVSFILAALETLPGFLPHVLMLTLESEFGVKIPDEDAQRFETVGDVVKWIEGAMA